jgi:ribonucleoside-diphosphate reductase subunit M1
MIVLMAFDVETNGKISQSAGGIGLAIHNVCNRFLHSWNKWNFKRNRSMLRVFNTAARYVDQGGGKRKVVCDLHRNLAC